MRRRWISLVTVAVVLAGCAAPAQEPPTQVPPSPPPSPTAAASPEVVCDSSQFQPTASLACGPAIAAAVASLAAGHPPIVRETFRWGGLCPPGAPCVPPLGGAGIVIVDFASEPPVFVYVTADTAGSVQASSPAPYPSGY